ncbi:MAG: DUF6055 domain-containing protein [Myxococcota bacterium]|nr:DUF6055 domain-containing protein [Myxococcota bacterium]
MWSLLSLAWAQPCGTLTFFEDTALRTRTQFPVPPPSSEKLSRDVYQLPNVLFSENFALHWGSELSFSESEATIVLEEFERSWTYEVQEMQYPAPLGSDGHYFNVYLGDSGNGAPSSYGNAGYYTVDDDGWPMIVIDYQSIVTADSFSVIPHEFFHAVQHACDSYDYEAKAAWYWEASAVWIESMVYPQDPNYAAFLFGFAFLPHKSLGFFDYFDSGALQEYYQYGAFIFPRYLTDYHVDDFVVRDSWVNARNAEEPLAWFESYFADQGQDFDEILIDFAARNTHWDYPHQNWYTYYLDYYTEYYPSDDYSITQGIHSSGTVGFAEVSRALLPERYGVNYLRMNGSNMDSIQIDIEGESSGDAGSIARWHATVVREQDGSIAYQTVPFEEHRGSLLLSDVYPTETITLVVMPSSETWEWGESFSYRYSFSEPVSNTEESDPEEIPKQACSSVPIFELTLWCVPLVLYRQRQKKGSDSSNPARPLQR